jgi:hypothetical protein
MSFALLLHSSNVGQKLCDHRGAEWLRGETQHHLAEIAQGQGCRCCCGVIVTSRCGSAKS